MPENVHISLIIGMLACREAKNSGVHLPLL